MAESGFQVVFDGQLVEGADQGQAKAGLARLFKTDVARIEPLFAGRPTVVKQGLDAATAEKYRLAFERAGAVATVVGPDGAALETVVARVSRDPWQTARGKTVEALAASTSHSRKCLLWMGSLRSSSKSVFDRRINLQSVSAMMLALRLPSDNNASSPNASPSFKVAKVTDDPVVDWRITLQRPWLMM